MLEEIPGGLITTPQRAACEEKTHRSARAVIPLMARVRGWILVGAWGFTASPTAMAIRT